MLTITYLDHNTSEKRSIGPATHFRIVGPSLRMGLQEQEVARFHHHFGCWYVGDSASDILAIEDTEICLVNPEGGQSPPLGPFDGIRFVGNILRQRRSNDRAIARLEPEVEQWRLLDDNSLWAEIDLLPSYKTVAHADRARVTPEEERRLNCNKSEIRSSKSETNSNLEIPNSKQC